MPWLGVGERSFSAVIDEVFTRRGLFFYQQYFQAEGVAEAEAEADVRGFLRLFYYAISGEGASTWPTDKVLGDPLLKGLVDREPFPAWMTAADLDYYTAEFERSGLRGPLNRYRNHDRDWAWQQPLKDRRIEQPAFFIARRARSRPSACWAPRRSRGADAAPSAEPAGRPTSCPDADTGRSRNGPPRSTPC